MRGQLWGLWKPPLGTKVDTTHPLYPGMELWHLCNEGSGQLINDLSEHGFSRRGVQNPAGASPGLWIPGPFGPSLNFNGTSNWVAVGDRQAGTGIVQGYTGMPVAANQPITISFWMRITANGVGNTCIAHNGNNANASGFPWEVNWSSSFTNVIRYNVAGPNFVQQGVWDGNGEAIALNKYTHVLITDDGKMAASSIAFWLNGRKISSQQTLVPNPATKPTVNGPIGWGGSNPADFGQFYAGLMDNFQIWSRVLPDSQIKSLYSNPFAACVVPPWRRYYIMN